jgi:two-component system, OmpR family, response regulator
MNPNILVVDDQPDIRELLRAVLTIKGFQVTTAAGGPQALELLEAGASADLILLDVQMPDMDGWDTLAAIRQRFGADGPMVVMCTVKGHPQDLIHGWASGCDGYIWKPFDMTVLVGEINDVLARPPADRGRIRRAAIGEAQLLLRSIT